MSAGLPALIVVCLFVLAVTHEPWSAGPAAVALGRRRSHGHDGDADERTGVAMAATTMVETVRGPIPTPSACRSPRAPTPPHGSASTS